MSPRQGVTFVVQMVTIRVIVRVIAVTVDERCGGGGGAERKQAGPLYVPGPAI